MVTAQIVGVSKLSQLGRDILKKKKNTTKGVPVVEPLAVGLKQLLFFPQTRKTSDPRLPEPCFLSYFGWARQQHQVKV